MKGVYTDYSYISDSGELTAGTYVEVPFGKQNSIQVGKVVWCGEFDEESVPYPVEKTKRINRVSRKRSKRKIRCFGCNG